MQFQKNIYMRLENDTLLLTVKSHFEENLEFFLVHLFEVPFLGVYHF